MKTDAFEPCLRPPVLVGQVLLPKYVPLCVSCQLVFRLHEPFADSSLVLYVSLRASEAALEGAQAALRRTDLVASFDPLYFISPCSPRPCPLYLSLVLCHYPPLVPNASCTSLFPPASGQAVVKASLIVQHFLSNPSI